MNDLKLVFSWVNDFVAYTVLESFFTVLLDTLATVWAVLVLETGTLAVVGGTLDRGSEAGDARHAKVVDTLLGEGLLELLGDLGSVLGGSDCQTCLADLPETFSYIDEMLFLFVCGRCNEETETSQLFFSAGTVSSDVCDEGHQAENEADETGFSNHLEY